VSQVESSTQAVTFLFTDIEGSTGLWERYPEAMRVALAAHDGLVRRGIEEQGGHIFKTVGDAFYAAFPSATRALASAIAAQRALYRQTWPDIPALRVRMALNTGTAEARDGDYFGPALNRVARLLAAGHGGQTLISLSTKEALGVLPDDISLRDMGERRLKDLSRPERIFQVVVPDLPSDFPPLNTLEAVPNNLPTALTSFVGRERELAEVKRHLEESHLLTLTGAGGCGKTRLALQVAADLLDSFSGGLWLIELGSITDPATVPYAVATAMGVREEPSVPLTATLAAVLRNKVALVILDNCEHLIAACADLTDTLLRACPDLKIIASSREALGIIGETIWRVPSLQETESIRLFEDRARAVAPAFLVNDQNVKEVTEICQRLDGIPLALELAAARVNVLSVDQISTRLKDRFRLLTGGSRTALPRQRTLRAAIDWSYDLLSQPERKLLRRLSAFSGGFTLEAAEHVCADEEVSREDILDHLSKLVEKSLVSPEEHGREVRYGLLEMVYQYSRDRLLEAGESEDAGQKHRDYFLHFVEQAAPELVGPNQATWFDRLELEHDNLRAALTWTLGETANTNAGLSLATGLFRFWFLRGYFAEGRHWLGRVIEHAGSGQRTSEWARALRAAATLALDQGDYTSGRSLLETATAIFRELNDKGAVAACLLTLANHALMLGDFQTARSRCEESLARHRELGNARGIANSLSLLGSILEGEGDYASARTHLQESLTVYRQIGQKDGIAYVLGALGNIASSEEQYEPARALYKESLEIYRTLGSKRKIASALLNLGDIARLQQNYEGAETLSAESLSISSALETKPLVAFAQHNLGLIAHARGRLDQARSFLREALNTRFELREVENVVHSLEAFATLAMTEGQLSKAARIYGAAAALRASVGASLAPQEQEVQNSLIATLKSRLSSDVFLSEWNAGQQMRMEDAVAYVLE
jgi:predicted ATPase/class 3 adenylate cyclase